MELYYKSMSYYLYALIFILGCTQIHEEPPLIHPRIEIRELELPVPPPDYIAVPDSIKLADYRSIISALISHRNAFGHSYSPSIDSVRDLLHTTLLNEIWPAWYGTVWDYNGYTNEPNNGLIACGYFVSTTLKHAGFNLNRFDVAKSYSMQIVNILCDSSTMATYTEISDLLNHIETRPSDIYIIGLSNHVGFLIKDNDKIDFVHSNYSYPMCVIREPAISSEALNWSSEYWIGSLLYSDSTIRNWIQNEVFQ